MHLKTTIVMVGSILLGSLVASEVPTKDTSYKHNVLPNGLTYYVKKNSFPENRASIRLFVKAGSLHEEDNQQGLAHFLEHMLFRGSENFEDWEVINFLESIGAQFGPDTNAYTSFDQTCYMLELPLEKEGVLEKGMLICSDWASKATINDELVQKERTVIMDEYNLSMKQSSTRQFRKIFDTFLSNSRYNIRWPIGLKEVILNSDPQLIRDFYKKWYRADRMAVVAVGDFDEDEVEAMIIKYFSGMEKPSEVLVEPDTALNLPKESIFEVFQDDEQQINIGFLWSLVDNEEEEDGDTKEITAKSMRKSIYKAIFAQVLAQRLDLKTKINPAPFVAQFPMNIDIDRLGIRGLAFCPFEDRPYEGIKEIMREMARLFTFGPSEHEFSDIVGTLKEEVKATLANTHRITHASVANNLLSNYFEKTSVYTEDDRLNYKLDVFDEVSKEDLLAWIKESDFEPMEHIVFQVSDESLISKERIAETVEEWLKEDIVDAEQVVVEEFTSEHKSSDDKAEYTKQYDEELKFTTVVLNNGMKIILQPTDLEKKIVTVQLIGEGGKTLLSDDLLPSADYAAYYAIECGIGNLVGPQFDSFLKKKNIYAACSISLNQRLIYFSGTNELLSTMLSLSKSAFTERLRDKNIWEGLNEKHTELYKNSEKDPSFYFSNYLTKHYHKNHPIYMPYKPWDSNEEDAYKVLEQLFSDPSEFNLFVTGDFDADEILPQIVSLFHSEKSDEPLQVPVIPTGASPTEHDDITIFRGAESHCKNYMYYGTSFSFEHINDMTMTAAAFDHIITHRLLEKLRKEMGDTYSVRLSSQRPLAPDLSELLLVVNFGCEPEKAENMKKAVRQELATFLTKGISDEELATAKEILLERERVSFLSNAGIQRAHISSVMLNLDVHDVTDYKSNIERQVTKKRIEAYAEAAFAEGRHFVSYTIKPETHKE